MIHKPMRWAALTMLVFVGFAPAQLTFTYTSLDEAPTSAVNKVPADALFFTSGQRLGEQVDMFLKSNAYAKLRALPALKFAHQQMMQEAHRPGNPMSEMAKFFQMPENVEMANVLVDLVRNEVFSYGGPDTMRLMHVAGQMNFGMRLDRIMKQIQNANDPDLPIKNVLATLKENVGDLVAPDLVIGFRLTNAAAARKQLARLAEHTKEHLAHAPKEFQGRIKSEKIGDADALVLHLDGSMIPWNEVNIERYEDEKGEFKMLVDALKKLTLNITLAIKGDYTLLCIGKDSSAVAKFDAGAALASRSELAPLKKFADRKITAISYSSLKLAEMMSTTEKQANEMIETVKDTMKQAPINEDLRKKIGDDIGRLGKEIFALGEKPAASMGLEFMTDTGSEGYDYVYRSSEMKPLTILDRLGGNPLVAIADRGADSTPAYRALVKWLTVFYNHGEAVLAELVNDQIQDQVKAAVQVAQPYLQRFDDHTGNQLLPALADGQSALVLDNKWTSKQWFPDVDQKGSELPMLELGLVVSVSDPNKLLEAGQGYRKLVNDLVTIARGWGAQIPRGGIPEPQTAKAGSATAYYWPLPDMGQDKAIVPNLALSKFTFSIALSTQHAARLHDSKPLVGDCAKLAGGEGPIAIAWLDFAGLVKTARPWVEKLGVPALQAEAREDAPEGLRAKDIPAQVGTLFDVLSCLKSFAAATYVENGATVTHHRSVISDLR